MVKPLKSNFNHTCRLQLHADLLAGRAEDLKSWLIAVSPSDPSPNQKKLTNLTFLAMVPMYKVAWQIRLSGFLTVSTYSGVYEWNQPKATLDSYVAPYFLPRLFMERVWPVEKDHVYFYKLVMT